jgi:hypothetical protein
MNKKILALILLVVTLVSMTACVEGGIQLVDTTWTYEQAVISLLNGEVVKGKVESWLDFENSDMIQVKIDGKNYLTHSTNVVLISE